MSSEGDYQIVVTYRDGNGVWKVRPVDRNDVRDRATGPNERTVSCIVPDFWSGVPHSAHIEHVAVAVGGRTVHLPWPPPGVDPTSRSALTMHVRLRYDPDATPTSMPTSVEWADERAS